MKRKISTWFLPVVIIVSTGNFTSLNAQYNDYQADEWTFSLSQKLLIPIQLQSDVTALGVTQGFTLKTKDFFTFDDVFTGAWRFDAQYKNYGIFTELSYTYAEDSDRIQDFPLPPALAQIINTRFNPPFPIPPGTPADARIGASGSALTIDFGAMYKIMEGAISESSDISYFLKPYISARLSVLKSELDFELDLATIPVVRTISDIKEEVFKSVAGFQFGLTTAGDWSAIFDSSFGSSIFNPESHRSLRISQDIVYSPREIFHFSVGYQFRHLDYEHSGFGLSQTQHALSLGIRAGF